MYNEDYKPYQHKINLPAVSPEKAHLPQTNHRYHVVQHHYDSILSNLRVLVEPYVEVGFDAQQIKQELHKQGHSLVLTHNIETVISTIIGEQE